MVVRVCRHPTIGEVDVPAIEQPAVGSDGDEECRVAVLGNPHRRSLARPYRHVVMPSRMQDADGGARDHQP